MTAQQIEAPPSPYVSLYSRGIAESEALLLTASNATSDPADAFRQALLAERLVVIQRTKEQLSKAKVVTSDSIIEALDIVWASRVHALSRFIGPSIAEAYVKAFRAANAGDVPIKLIYSLAEQHVKRTGDYFHKTSSDALVQGFNTFVNRQVPPRAALARVIEGYGMTPRQMSGMTSAKYFDSKVETATSRSVTAKVRNYIAKSISSRLDIFGRQESHNLNQQAQQVAWMWMVDHGKLPKTAEKMWLTARDERVCGVCGPLHRAKVPVGEQFILDDGQKLYVPGAHTNCRCKVRLQFRLEVVGKADRFLERQHPRDRAGRFVETDERMADEQLERLVSQAKKVQEEERAEAARKIELAAPPVEAEEEAPTGIQLARGGLASGLSGAKLSPMKLSSGVKLSAPPKLSAAPVERTRLSTAATRGATTLAARPQIQLSMAQQAKLQAQLVSAFGEVKLKAQQKRPKTIERYTNLEPFMDVDGKQTNVYGLVDFDIVVNEEEEEVLLGQDDDLYRIKDFDTLDDQGSMWSKVLEKYQENQNKLYFNITAGRHNTFIRDVDPDYGNVEATIDSEAILAAIETLGSSKFQGALANKQYEVEWYDDEDENVKTEELSAWQVAEKLGLKTSDVEVDLVTLDHGYKDDVDYNVGSEHEMEFWKAPGAYDIIHPERRRLNFAAIGDETGDYGLPVRILHIEPREKVEFVVERNMNADETERFRGD